MIYVETQIGKKLMGNDYRSSSIQEKITIANSGIQPSSPHTMYSLARIVLTHTSMGMLAYITSITRLHKLTSMGMLAYITSITRLHKLIMNRSHNYTSSS